MAFVLVDLPQQQANAFRVGDGGVALGAVRAEGLGQTESGIIFGTPSYLSISQHLRGEIRKSVRGVGTALYFYRPDNVQNVHRLKFGNRDAADNGKIVLFQIPHQLERMFFGQGGGVRGVPFTGNGFKKCFQPLSWRLWRLFWPPFSVLRGQGQRQVVLWLRYGGGLPATILPDIGRN